MSRRLLASALLLTFALSACGGDDSAKGATTTTTTNAKGGVTTTSSGGTATTKAGLAKPTIAKKDGPAPTTLKSTDLIVGTGAEATTGKTVEVHYVGVRYADGKQFDASWDRGSTFSFPLGAGRVIKGWDQGVAGMKVGGRRELIIPPDLAYGDRGTGADIKPGDTLIFVVDLIAVK